MLDILKEYQKKCHLRNKSNDEETSKKLREGSLDNSSACSDVSVNNDAFTEGLKSPECVGILMNSMLNLEKEIGQIFKMLKKTEHRQIKGKCQLTDLAKGVDFTTQKFDEYEKDRREKDVIMANLPSEIKSANMKVENLEKKMDRQEQYSRRHCNLIHGLKKDKKESTDIEF